MAIKDVVFSQSARQRVGRGIDTLANAVKVTLGPRGRNVVLGREWGPPLVTKDGVTVANEIDLGDQFQNLGAQMVKEVASKTGADAGDGTTTATVLAQIIYREGLKLVAARHNPLDLKRGIDAAVENVVASLKKLAKPVSTREEIAQVGTISANGDAEVGKLFAEAMDKIGRDGVIMVEMHNGISTELEIVEGVWFDRGYISPYFVTDATRLECDLEDPLILVYEGKISSLPDFVPLLEQVIGTGRPLLVIAEDVTDEALQALVVNQMRGTMKCCAVKLPAFGDVRKEMLQDIAAMVGAKPILEHSVRLSEVKLADLGRAGRVSVEEHDTTILEGAGNKEAIEGRVKLVKAAIERSNSEYDKMKLQERLAKLAGGVAVISVGAPTELALKEKKMRIEDALAATRAAVAEGIVAGGGSALVRCLDALDGLKFEDGRQYGVGIVRRALEEPLRTIARNAGADASVVVSHVREGGRKKGGAGFGFNAETETFEDLIAAGVVDPTKVVRSALQNAASVSGLLLTTEAIMAERPKPERGLSSSMNTPTKEERGPETSDFRPDDEFGEH
ncbi:MAG TPA: chaperonin GroEL [Polyangia bacterium]|nr:chaperonin GroEL [Polyangia bacterium]